MLSKYIQRKVRTANLTTIENNTNDIFSAKFQKFSLKEVKTTFLQWSLATTTMSEVREVMMLARGRAGTGRGLPNLSEDQETSLVS